MIEQYDIDVRIILAQPGDKRCQLRLRHTAVLMPGKNINHHVTPVERRQIITNLLADILRNMQIIRLQRFFIQLEIISDERKGLTDVPVFTVKIKRLAVVFNRRPLIETQYRSGLYLS